MMEESSHDFQPYALYHPPSQTYVPCKKCSKCGFMTQDLKITNDMLLDIEVPSENGLIRLNLNCEECQAYRVMRQ